MSVGARVRACPARNCKGSEKGKGRARQGRDRGDQTSAVGISLNYSCNGAIATYIRYFHSKRIP